MKIHIDYDACEANAVCEGIAPEVFLVDDDDNLHAIADPDSHQHPRLGMIASGCTPSTFTHSVRDGEPLGLAVEPDCALKRSMAPVTTAWPAGP